MRIISTFKDYYDYLVGPDADDRIVYLRHCQAYQPIDHQAPESTDAESLVYRLLGPHNPHLTTALFASLPADLAEPDEWAVHFCGLAYPFTVDSDGFRFYNREARSVFGKASDGWRPKPVPTTLNATLAAPVVVPVGDRLLTNVQLSSLNFGQCLLAEEAFMAIYNFLIPNERQPDANPDDLTRYEAKGFDRKTSFRKPKSGGMRG